MVFKWVSVSRFFDIIFLEVIVYQLSVLKNFNLSCFANVGGV
jgi:hypothetical protein